MAARATFSLSHELVAALDAIASDRDESRSASVEMMLREHSLVARAIGRTKPGKRYEMVGQKKRMRIQS